MTFIKVKASKKSIDMRKPICGVGINDAWYTISKRLEGKTKMCPVYHAWSNMIMRCYRPEYAEKFATYKDCTVCDEWLLFSEFEKWATPRILEGYDLDKDILFIGNKQYSPEKCMFVPKVVNYIVTGKRKSKGGYKTGVSWATRDKAWRVVMSVDGKSVSVGTFKTEDEAHLAYFEKKVERVVDIAMQQKDDFIRSALMAYSELMRPE